MTDGYIFDGCALRGYRSFGADELSYVAPLGKITLLAGQNNAGKSNALKALEQIPAMVRAGDWAPAREEYRFRPEGWPEDQPIYFSIAFQRDALLAGFREELHIAEQQMEFLDAVSATEIVSRGYPGLVWFDFELSVAEQGGVVVQPDAFRTASHEIGMAGHAVSGFLAVSRALGDGTSSTSIESAITLFVDRQRLWTRIPRVVRLDAARRLTSDASETTIEDQVRNGANLIQGLADLRSPNDRTRSNSERKWGQITEFVRSVLEDPSAEILINSDRDELSVRTLGRAMALSSLGSGIEQVVILAAFATVNENIILAIEEPEIYLHPSLQRRLIGYLATTSNRYLISTHSAHLLNSELATIAHVTQESGWTRVHSATRASDIAAIAADLGYRASDLVQANYVIWVEGPSDRLYVRHWIGLVDERLIEGAHYTIMFYGGALLNHLAADDPEVEEFIMLNRLGRNFAILMDRDKALGVGPNATKERVLAELRGAGNWGWVTEGYTIENYIDPARLKDVFDDVYPEREYGTPSSPNVSPIKATTINGTRFVPSKIVIAKAVIVAAGEDPSWWRLDVLEMTKELASRISSANGLEPRIGPGPGL